MCGAVALGENVHRKAITASERELAHESARAQRAAPGVAPRRVAARGRGRAWVALALLGFVLVGAAVIWRRAQGHAQAKRARSRSSSSACSSSRSARSSAATFAIS